MSKTRVEFTKAVQEEMNKVTFPKSTYISQEEARKWCDTIFAIVKQSIDEDGDFSYPNFGKFRKIKKEEREAINPKTMGRITVPEHYVVKFTPSKPLVDLVNKK